MRIGIISNTTFNIYNFRLGLMRYLQQNGHEVLFISPEDEYVEKMAAGIDAPYFPLKNMARKGYNPLVDFKMVMELRSIFKKQKIDLVFTYTIKPNVYTAMAILGTKTKLISNITGLGFVFLKNSLGNSIAKLLLRHCMWQSYLVVFQNETDRQLFIQKKYLAPDKTVLINGSGINLDRYQPNQTPSRNAFTFLFVGRLLFDKGIRELAEAAKHFSASYPEVRFHWLGALDDGNPSAVSQKQLDLWMRENPKVTYFGHQDDVIPFLKEAQVVVLPSYREGIPRVLLEAMAMQKPFITTDAPGCKDVTIPGKNGLMVPMADATALLEAMIKIYTMSENDRHAMGLFGRQLAAEKFDEKIIVHDYLKLILRLTEK